jgi:hypothetical protein
VGAHAALSARQPQAGGAGRELEHKSRRQDVLVDDELIYAFYDQHLPADVVDGRTLRPGGARPSAPRPSCCSRARS